MGCIFILGITRKVYAEDVEIGDYTYDTDGGSTMVTSVTGDSTLLNFVCTKTYADGSTRKDLFSHYLWTSSSYYTIPGLANTNVLGENCSTMVPQGICKMKSFILITAYAYNDGTSYNSVVYILNNSYELLATLVLPSTSHVGGIIYDGTMVWIPDDADENNIDMIGYSFTQLMGAVYYTKSAGAKSVQVEPSYRWNDIGFEVDYCTYYDGRLWLGDFDENGTSYIYGYTLTYNSSETSVTRKTKDRYIEAPEKTQGISFYYDSYHDDLYLLVSTSYGRTINSKIYVYKPTDYDNPTAYKNGVLLVHKGHNVKNIAIPNMAENIYATDATRMTWIIFESAARLYTQDLNNKGNFSTNRSDCYCALDAYLLAVE